MKLIETFSSNSRVARDVFCLFVKNITNKIHRQGIRHRRSAYDTGGIPTLDGDTQTLEQKLSGSRLASGDSKLRRPMGDFIFRLDLSFKLKF